MIISEVILCKYGEIVLKGANRQNFESMLVKELRRRASPYGEFKIYFKQSTIYIEPKDDLCDMEGMYSAAKKVFGIVGVNRAAVCEKTMESITETAREYLPDKLFGKRTFKVDAKRSDKKFPLKSPEISAEIGGVILSCVRGIKVDVRDPDVTVTVVRKAHISELFLGNYGCDDLARTLTRKGGNKLAHLVRGYRASVLYGIENVRGACDRSEQGGIADVLFIHLSKHCVYFG
jgi:tRNA(Ser,Leu) C12 N-acetylase TAN1